MKTTPLSINETFGKWTVLSSPISKPQKHGTEIWYLCRCKCGTEREVRGKSLRTGRSIDCGCDRSMRRKINRTRHGGAYTPLHNVWSHMKRRCHNPSDASFIRYGGRGIQVCEAWRNDFAAFQSWALSHGYTENLTIERKDNNGPYTLDNCEWIPLSKQALNRGTTRLIAAFGELKPVAEWGRDPRCKADHRRIVIRIKFGWPPELAISTPPQSAGTRLRDVLINSASEL